MSEVNLPFEARYWLLRRFHDLHRRSLEDEAAVDEVRRRQGQ